MSEELENEDGGDEADFMVPPTEYARAHFMDQHGLDMVAVEWTDQTTEEDKEEHGEDFHSLSAPIPDMTIEEKRAMYLAQIAWLQEEKTQMIDDYDELVDRLRASIEILDPS